MADDSDDERVEAGKLHKNQPYDESLDLPDSEEIASQYTPTPRVEIHKGGSSAKHRNTSAMSDESDDDVQIGGPQQRTNALKHKEQSAGKMLDSVGPSKGSRPTGGVHSGVNEDDDEDDDDDDDDDDVDDDDDDEDEHGRVEGLYNPADYEHLAVNPEIKELFQYISRYATQNIELEYRLQPFIPDYIPAVGDIDAFIKIPRVDGKADSLGLTVLDEPCAKQSDPHVLDLTLRSLTKQSNIKQMTVKSIENAENNHKAIDNWIKSIAELHRTQPAPTVHYAKNMPEIDSLMQEWPTEFEELLKEVHLPLGQLECDLPQYVDIICSLLDIPVYKSRIQSLHLLFTLFSEFKNSQHFQAMAGGDNNRSAAMQDDADRLQL